jgi:hypothetical protein
MPPLPVSVRSRVVARRSIATWILTFPPDEARQWSGEIGVRRPALVHPLRTAVISACDARPSVPTTLWRERALQVANLHVLTVLHELNHLSAVESSSSLDPLTRLELLDVHCGSHAVKFSAQY